MSQSTAPAQKMAMLAATLLALSLSGCVDVSQYGQTTALRQMHGAASGTFIEFGCANGKDNSNTFMLECLGWHGFCVEPVDVVRFRANAYSGAVCTPGQNATDIIVANMDGLHGVDPDLGAFRARRASVKRVRCYNLDDLRKRHDLHHVTYMTVDTEGNELELLQSYAPLDWVTWLQVECNTRHACDNIRTYLNKISFTMKRFFPFKNGRGGGDMLFRHR